LLLGTPSLLARILHTYLLTPIPSEPAPHALALLRVLADASRAGAATLGEPADALLRSLAAPSDASPFDQSLGAALDAGTLGVFAALARYGLAADIVAGAAALLTDIGPYVRAASLPSSPGTARAWRTVARAHLALVRALLVCATNPHGTDPPHALPWSQASARGWVRTR
jgi:hypothetical protein